jgi:hypothetical protein
MATDVGERRVLVIAVHVEVAIEDLPSDKMTEWAIEISKEIEVISKNEAMMALADETATQNVSRPSAKSRFLSVRMNPELRDSAKKLLLRPLRGHKMRRLQHRSHPSRE